VTLELVSSQSGRRSPGSLGQSIDYRRGYHQHFFYGATAMLTVNTGDTLSAYVTGSEQSAVRNHAAMAQRLLGTPGVLGCEPNHLRRLRDIQPASDGRVCACRPVGPAYVSGDPGRPEGMCSPEWLLRCMMTRDLDHAASPGLWPPMIPRRQRFRSPVRPITLCFPAQALTVSANADDNVSVASVHSGSLA